MKAYILLRDIPGLNAGSVFVHDALNTRKLGSIGCGAMILAWDGASCGGKGDKLWCAESHVFPGQMINETGWFAETPNPVVDGKLRYHLSDTPRSSKPDLGGPANPENSAHGDPAILKQQSIQQLKRKLKKVGADGPAPSMLAGMPAQHADLMKLREIIKLLIELL